MKHSLPSDDFSGDGYVAPFENASDHNYLTKIQKQQVILFIIEWETGW